MRRIVLALLAMFAVAMIVPSAGAQSQNFIRVMHASPDAPNVDVFVNGQAVLTDVPFFAYSDYLTLGDGTYEVAISPTGQGTDASVWVGELTVQGGVYGTVAAVNFVENLDAVLYDDDVSPVPAGNARVRIIHASPNAPAVDVKLAGTDTVVLANAPYRASAYLEVPAGTYQFDISPAGSSDVVFTTPALTFLDGWTYTLVATGDLNENFWVQSRVDRTGQ
ncbi:MAG: DUF4397 domain-containing protein [Oscillochloris sp.]|nr:DUF4397 domain-containing protein [Oscillochloris sp.]